MIRIAIPNKGALSENTVAMFKEAGYRCHRSSRELKIIDTQNDLEFVFLRPRDIAVYVSRGIIELGVTGRDLAINSQSIFHELLPLQFGFSKFCYAAPAVKKVQLNQLNHARIATSYPHIVEKDLQQRGYEATLIQLDGAVEISIGLGIADVIADVVESGTTMKEAGLEIIGEPILQSEAILITGNPQIVEQVEIQILIDRLKGILVARNYAMIEYDIPANLQKEACTITPGIQSPTISPLMQKEWVAVKSMIEQKKANVIMDQLKALGAKGIIVTDIRHCRL